MSYLKVIRDIIKRMLCKHEYVEMKEIPKMYQCISGERIYIVCEKCGKIKGSYFREYEGMGYK